ncbi:MAG: hypothetical protein GVY36_10105 [Verrucomicrobia bacterium]|jgi:hypothetical protein|nr:hypothetical protein [Verrucomicrobiota bacterium]
MKTADPFNWKKKHEIWFIAGTNISFLDWDFLFPTAPVWKTFEEMNGLFLNRHQVQAAHSFPIRWDDFEKTFSCELHYMRSPAEILEPLLAFSRDESSVRSTYSIKEDITRRLGVQFRYMVDSGLPAFYYDNTLTSEDIFFNKFQPAKIEWCVSDPLQFAIWVLGDRRWAVTTMVNAI